MRQTQKLSFILFSILACSPALADEPVVQKPEDFLTQYAATRGFSLGTPSDHVFTPNGHDILFLRSGPRSFVRDLFIFKGVPSKEQLLLSAEQILAGAEETLSIEERARRERTRSTARGIASFELSGDGKRILVPLSGRLFVIERATEKITELTSASGYPTDAKFSPDANKVSCVRNGDLFVFDIATGRETQLTKRPSPGGIL